MRQTLLTLLPVVVGLSLASCGGSPPPAPAEPKSGHEHEHCKDCQHGDHGKHAEHGGPGKPGAHEKHHGKLSPALREFHETLAPVWHSPAGAERVTKACAAATDLSQKATATGDAELISATNAARDACAQSNRPIDPVEAAIAKVHNRFHQLAER